jgi:TRAP-type C4-dicarboxylate transport system permease large subunit
MIMMVNLGIGLITPPVGTVLFVGSGGGQAACVARRGALRHGHPHD